MKTEHVNNENVDGISYDEIKAKRIGKAWVATTRTYSPIKSVVNMQGKTEFIAIEKLRLFLNGEPYRHLDTNQPIK